MKEPKDSYIFSVVLFLVLLVALIGVSIWAGMKILKLLII